MQLRGEPLRGTLQLRDGKTPVTIPWETTFPASLGYACIRCGHSCRNNDIMIFALDNLADAPLQEEFPLLQLRENGACVLLQEPNTCTIHARKPALCREYPCKAVFSEGRAFVDITLSCTSLFAGHTGTSPTRMAEETIRSSWQRMKSFADEESISRTIRAKAHELGVLLETDPLSRLGIDIKETLGIVHKSYCIAVESGQAPFRYPVAADDQQPDTAHPQRRASSTRTSTASRPYRFSVLLPNQDGVTILGIPGKHTLKALPLSAEAMQLLADYLAFFLNRATFLSDATLCLKALATRVSLQDSLLIEETARRIAMTLIYLAHASAAVDEDTSVSAQDISRAMFMADNTFMAPCTEIADALLRSR